MSGAILKVRRAVVGNDTAVRFFSDDEETLAFTGLVAAADSGAGDETTAAVRIFIIGGDMAERAAVDRGRDCCVLFDDGFISLSGAGRLRYGDWYGKAQSVIDLAAKTAVLVMPGLRFYNRLFVSHQILRPLLDRLLFECGYVPLHAAGAAYGGRACLIAGDTGRGKSTLVSGLVGAGFSFLGDDRILVARGDGAGCVVHRFPEYIRLPVPGNGPKQSIAPALMDVPSAPPGILLFLDGGETGGGDGISGIGRSEAAARLSRCLVPFMEEEMRRVAFGAIADLCSIVRSYRVGGRLSPADRLKRVLEIVR